MNLATAIKKKKATMDSPEGIKAFVELATEQMLEEMLPAKVEEALKNLLEEKTNKKLKGEKGDKGDKGDTGRAGMDATNITEVAQQAAKMIPRPRDGYNGINGKDGKKGERGEPGKQGKEGLPGRPGKDGSPDTPDQVVEKVNDASRKIRMSAIDGLPTELDNLRVAIRSSGGRKGGGGGGGMGNVQHETKSVGSATTTITTNYKIAGQGYAVWAYYQGQFIVRGTHYTVGTDQKTLTLIFTPDNSTAIDLVYIRT